MSQTKRHPTEDGMMGMLAGGLPIIGRPGPAVTAADFHRPPPIALYFTDEDYAELGPEARYILEQLVQQWANKFVEASRHYGDNTHHELGLQAQYVDLNRKFRVLKRSMWEGRPTTRESLRTILMDLIGHAFLSINIIDREEEARAQPETDQATKDSA